MGSSSIASGNDLIAGFLKKDLVWSDYGFSQDHIFGWLGWLDADQWLDQHFADIQQWAYQMVKQGDFSQVVLLGMGGSSMTAWVLSECMQRNTDFPPLLILDTSCPEKIHHSDINIKKALFIVSSKSGKTIESLSLMSYFYSQVAEVSTSPNNQFVAITDQGTWLHKHAQEKKFRRIFINPADIGGRYSALSHYGLVPCILSGIDLTRFVGRIKTFYQELQLPEIQQEIETLANQMAQQMLSGRYKMQFIIDPKITYFFFWVEQLIAESTGKQGKGLLPIMADSSNDCTQYAFCVKIGIGTGSMSSLRHSEKRLAGQDGLLFKQVLSSTDELGRLFLYWQITTAVACMIAGVNPFDQPDVEKSKHQTQLFLKKKNQLSFLKPISENNAYTIYTNGDTVSDSLISLIKIYLSDSSNYLSILTYLPDFPKVEVKLSRLVRALKQKNYTVTQSYGPRYLHSTGQMHKGGPDKGVFLQFTERHLSTIGIPGKEYGFSDLYRSQADGDVTVLHSLDRHIMRVELKADRLQSLDRLINEFTA